MMTFLVVAAAAVILGYGYLLWAVGRRPIRAVDRRLTAVDVELSAAPARQR